MCDWKAGWMRDVLRGWRRRNRSTIEREDDES